MIGLGTYAFFWQYSARANPPLSLPEMLQKTKAMGLSLFQICDYLPITDYTDKELHALRACADDLGITLELGTKGVMTAHLERFLHMADLLGVKLIRSMVNTPDHRPTLAEAESLLRKALPAYEASGVNLALETYEQMSSSNLVALVENVGSKALGICLDPANCVAALENPIEVIDRCAPYVNNLHVKDFVFTRRGGWIGFTLEGIELGKGLLDLDYMLKTVKPLERNINVIVEHWLTWRDDIEKTTRIENEWNEHNIAVLKQKTGC